MLFGPVRAEIAPGAVHVPGWLSDDEQRDLVAACREWARPPAGIRHTVMPTGGVMSVQTVCLGWHWVPYKYLPTADDGAPVKPFPDWLAELGRRAVADAYADLDPEQSVSARYRPDVALINFYDGQAKMGMHADKDERSPAPVVSLSLGSTCVFRFGNAASRNRPWQDIRLESGDLFVFGGESRFAYHGVLKTLPGTGRPQFGIPSGRLNITLRESGLGESDLPPADRPGRDA
jgi:alkylated DNA repair protein (DNA oxidative demethylase)